MKNFPCCKVVKKDYEKCCVEAERINKTKFTPKKYVPINADLEELLIEMGMNNNNNSNDFILYPERTVTTNVIMDRLSKSFTHYKKGAGIEKDISFKNLRKTYINGLIRRWGTKQAFLPLTQRMKC
jgi:hypothetical protein